MGLHQSWIAVRGTDEATLRELFALKKRSYHAHLRYLELPNGWSVVGHDRNGFHDREKLIDASRLSFALRLDVNDHGDPFSSTLTAAQDGEILWEVSIVDDEWRIEGEPPIGQGALLDLGKDSNGFFGDQYDIPPALMKIVSGFDIMEWFPLYVPPPSVAPSSESKSLWARFSRIYHAWGSKEVVGLKGHTWAWTYVLFHVCIITAVVFGARWIYRYVGALV